MELAMLVTVGISFALFELPHESSPAAVPKPAAPEAPLGINMTQEEAMKKYRDCQDKCKSQGENLECGANGWWFLNKCHRDCEGMEKAKDERFCNPYEKIEFDRYWKCQQKCEGKPERKECGEDGKWYPSVCKRECFGVRKEDSRLCQYYDKYDECDFKCMEQEYKPDCGVDGEWYHSKCQRECIGVKPGSEGKECPYTLHYDQYWKCQSKCKNQEMKPVCGNSFWFDNKCHLDCYGAKPGSEKSCPPQMGDDYYQ